MKNRIITGTGKTAAAILILILSSLAAPMIIAGTALAAAGTVPAVRNSTGTLDPELKRSGRLIVELQNEPLACRFAESPKKYGSPGGRRLSPGNRAARQYLRRLEQEQNSFVRKLETISPGVQVSRRLDYQGRLHENRYKLLFNGVSLDPGNSDRNTLLQNLRNLPEVKAVYPEKIYYPTLYPSCNLINVQALWDNPAIHSAADAGRGIKIAIMDAGIHHQAPMFSGTGFNFPPDIPAPGLGDPRNNNGKIIVSRAYFNPDDPPLEGDTNVWPGEHGISHGVHVAGIAAGNPVTAAYLGFQTKISGVAPAAWLMSYRVFYPHQSGSGGVNTTEGLAALEDIVADGADVLNFSVGGAPDSSGGYYDLLDRTLINAAKSGIFVVAANGNSGPGLGTMDHPSADYINVAASSKSSILTLPPFKVNAPGATDEALTNIDYQEADFGPYLPVGVTTYELISAAGIEADNFEGCSPWVGTPFANKAVLIERGDCDFCDKVFMAQKAGAVLVVIYNHNHAEGGDNLMTMGPSFHADEISIPSIFIKHSDGEALRDWCDTYGSASRLEMDYRSHPTDFPPDYLAYFSSRGPGVGEVLKPDITAPGVRILSQGYDPYAAGENRHLGFGIASGTSMATPHVAGAAALILQVHPDWPNSYIKSAIMTTSRFKGIKVDNDLPALPLEIGAGRLDLTRVIDPGIICQPPSVSFGRVAKGKNKSLTVTVTNISPNPETYTVSIFNPRAADGHEKSMEGVSFSPAQLTLKPKTSTTLTLTIDTTNDRVNSGDLQGFIVLSGKAHNAHLPFWARIVRPSSGEILLVDNDGSSADQEKKDYRKYYTEALDKLGKSYDVWDVDAQPADNLIPEAAKLARYPAMVYFSGDNWNPMDNLYTDRLTEYANGGGHIIAMGQNISNIFSEGDAFEGEKFFWDNILNGLVWQHGLTDGKLPEHDIVAFADAPSAFKNIHLDLSDSGDGAGNQFFIDEMCTYEDADLRRLHLPALLCYPDKNNNQYGIVAQANRFQPSLGIPEPPSAIRAIYASFGLEGINDQAHRTSRSKLLGIFLNWMADEPTAAIVERNNSTVTEKSFQALLDSPVINSWGSYYRWDFGDGSSPQGPFSDSACSHTYARPGNYLVRVEATDNYGNQAIGKYLVSKPDCLYYPHIATVDNWETEICVINLSADSTITGTFKAYADDGTPVSEIDDVVLPPRGRREITVGTTFSDPDRIGYIIFTASGDTLAGYTKFYVAGNYRVAIPAVRELNQKDIFVSHIASDDNWFTGLSLVNVTASARTLFIETDNGMKQTLELNPGEHKALSLRSLFAGQPQTGIQSAVIRNCAGIIGLELFGSGKQLSGILLQDDSATEIIYPHVASTDEWWTGVVAYNCATATSHLNFTTFNTEGKILTSNVSLDLTGHDKFIGSVAALDFPEATAWFRIKSSQPMTGFELFGTSNGLELGGYSSVNLSAPRGVFPKLEKDGFTGIAMVNATSLKASRVTLTAYDNDGHMVGKPQTISLDGYEKVVKVAEKLFSSDISRATYITYRSDRKLVGFQLNGTTDGVLLDGLPALR